MSAPPNIPRTRSSNLSVSVVVPSYNHARFVEKCLRSIMKQSIQPLELLVIDDGSNDDSVRIIERTLKDCTFACDFVARPNRGLAATLNEGLGRSRGEYFAYLGSDDMWLPQFLATRIETLAARPNAVLAYGHAYSIDAAERIIDCTTDWAAYVDGDVRRMLLATLAPLSPSVAYRRSAVARYGWNEGSVLEDYELYLRLSVDGDFAFDPRILSAWRQHAANASSNLSTMFQEKLAAQQRAAQSLNLSEKELKSYKLLATFRSAQEFMRQGQKSRALELARGSWRAAASAGELTRMVAGLLTPSSLVRSRRAQRRKQAHERYGSVEI
ncbi:MAG: glycosyltransferase [Pyrinomonadaceae bacterium]